jgi:hypothetical protein
MRTATGSAATFTMDTFAMPFFRHVLIDSSGISATLKDKGKRRLPFSVFAAVELD